MQLDDEDLASRDARAAVTTWLAAHRGSRDLLRDGRLEVDDIVAALAIAQARSASGIGAFATALEEALVARYASCSGTPALVERLLVGGDLAGAIVAAIGPRLST